MRGTRGERKHRVREALPAEWDEEVACGRHYTVWGSSHPGGQGYHFRLGEAVKEKRRWGGIIVARPQA